MPAEKAMAPHPGTLAWRIPWTEEPGGLQSLGSRRVGHNWATSLSLFTFMHWRRKWQPTPVFLPGESQGWGSLVGCRYGVAQSRTRLKWLSNGSSSIYWELPWWLRWLKHLLAVRENQVRSLGGEDPLEKEMTTHFSTLAWKIPWMEEPRRLQSIGWQRVAHDWATSF